MATKQNRGESKILHRRISGIPEYAPLYKKNKFKNKSILVVDGTATEEKGDRVSANTGIGIYRLSKK